MSMPTDITPKFALLPAEQEVAVPMPFASEQPAQTVGGFMASPSSLSAGNVSYNSLAEQILVGQATATLVGIGVFIGNAGDGTYDFRAGDPSGNYIQWDSSAATLTVKGTITATAGTIGGFSIGADYIRDAANSFGLASTVTGGDDVRFWAGAAFASRATAPFFVTEAGAVTAANIVATGTINAQGGYIGAPTTVLNISTSGLDVGVTGHFQGGQSAYNTGTGFFLGYSGAAYKFSIGNPAGDYLTWDGTTLSTNKFTLTGIGTFGGNGSDGALSVSSGTTTIDLGGAAYVVKNYTSIAITGTGKVAFSNPHANGTIIVLKSQGAVTITSSTSPALDASGMGAAGGTGVTNSGSGGTGNDSGGSGTDGISKSFLFTKTNKGTGGSTGGSIGGAASTFAFNTAMYSDTLYFSRYPNLFTGAGGGAGGGQHLTAAWSYTTGNGGRGGPSLIIECAGALNFTTTISAAGKQGTKGILTGSSVGSGAGAGGAGGLCYVLYNTLTANSGTIDVSGGAGQTSTWVGAGSSSNGGAGGGNAINAGASGSNVASDGTADNGAAGAAGLSVVAQNTFFA